METGSDFFILSNAVDKASLLFFCRRLALFHVTRMAKRSEGAHRPSLAVQRSTITKASVSAQAEMLDLDEQNTATPRAKTWDTAVLCYLIAGDGIGSALLRGNSFANATDRQKAGMADIGSSETVCQAE